MHHLLPQSVISALSTIHNSDYEILGYSFDKQIAIEDVEEAIKVIDNYSRPFSSEDLTKLLAKLFVKTKRKADDQISQDLMFAAYVEELIGYPADIVFAVLTSWPKQSMWWPSWHELHKEIEWRNKRKKLRQALVKKLEPNKVQKLFNKATKDLKNVYRR